MDNSPPNFKDDPPIAVIGIYIASAAILTIGVDILFLVVRLLYKTTLLAITGHF